MSMESAMIKEFLLYEWDPIGVGGSPNAENEYDGYVAPILSMLRQGKTKDELFTYMWWMETDHMGLDGNRPSTLEKASVLYERFHRQSPETGASL